MSITPRSPHLLLLTGVPGVGKTTALRTVARRLRGRQLRGFYTQEIRQDGVRRGFRAVTFAGRQATLAHVGITSRSRVGKYGVDLAVMDELADSALAPDPRIEVYLVDEIGKMECLSPRFVTALRRLLDERQPVVATVALRGAGLIAEVKRRPDAECWSVTHTNRDEIPDRALAWLAPRLTG